MEIELWNPETKHCLICGSTHETPDCPPENFAKVSCKCGNSFTMPWDAVFMASGMNCGQCGKDDDWNPPEENKPAPTDTPQAHPEEK